MSQTASFLADYLFPGLLVACGCLGLGVVNLLAQGNGHQAQGQPPAPRGRSVTPAPPRRAPPQAPAPAARAPGPPARARASVAALRPVARPTQHRVAFAGRRTRVTDVERERLRIFLAAARPDAAHQLVVVRHGPKRRARRRARRVVAVLRALGVPAAQLAGPELVVDPNQAPDGQDPGAVMIVIRKR